MKRSDMISYEDFKKMDAKLDASRDAALDLYTMMANSLGKTHSVTKKALTAYNKISRLKSDMRLLAKKNAGDTFSGKGPDNLFPDADASGKKGCVYHGWKK